MDPIDGTKPEALARWVNAHEVNWVPWMLPYMSSGSKLPLRLLYQVINLACNEALETADDLELRMTFGSLLRHIRFGPIVGSHPRDRDHVQRTVGLAIATAVETMSLGHPR